MFTCGPVPSPSSPHQPWNLTWVVRLGESFDILNTSSSLAPLYTYFPDLYFSLEKAWGGFEKEGNQWQARLTMRRNGFFTCPGYKGPGNQRTCGGLEALYCAAWSCVDTNDGEWKWATQADLVTMQFANSLQKTGQMYNINQNSTLIRISFTDKGKRDKRWVSGLNWGLFLYQRPWHGILLQVLLQAKPINLTPVGPNRVLNPVPEPQPQPNPTTPAREGRTTELV